MKYSCLPIYRTKKNKGPPVKFQKVAGQGRQFSLLFFDSGAKVRYSEFWNSDSWMIQD